ncbi:MAG: glutathione S-transferase family protein [Steroidobacteraceae bacterium]
MKLYGMAVSPFVSRVLLVARLKGIELPLVPPPAEESMGRMMERVALLRKNPAAELPTIQIMGDTKYMREINPTGRIPALEVDGKYLGESTTICEYLDDRYPDPPLLPSDPYDRARVRMLCRMCDLYVTSQAWNLTHHIDPLTRVDKRVAEIKDYLKVSLRELEQVMGAGPWAYGNDASLADCMMVYTFLLFQTSLYMTTTENLGFTAFDPEKPFSDNPKLAVWWRHLQKHPVIGPAMREYVEESRTALSAMVPDRSPASYGIFMRARSPRP